MEKLQKGINFLREHKKLSTVFLIAWMIAILSGYLFFYQEYLTPKIESVGGRIAVNG